MSNVIVVTDDVVPVPDNKLPSLTETVKSFVDSDSESTLRASYAQTTVVTESQSLPCGMHPDSVSHSDSVVKHESGIHTNVKAEPFQTVCGYPDEAYETTSNEDKHSCMSSNSHITEIIVGAEFESWDMFLQASQVHCDKTFQPMRLSRGKRIEYVNSRNTLGNTPKVQYDPKWVYRCYTLECMYGRRHSVRIYGKEKDFCRAKIYASIDRNKDKIVVQTVMSRHNHALHARNRAKLWIPGMTDRKPYTYHKQSRRTYVTQTNHDKHSEDEPVDEEDLGHESDEDESNLIECNDESISMSDDTISKDQGTPASTEIHALTASHSLLDLQFEISGLLSKNSSQMQTMLTSNQDDTDSVANTSKIISDIFASLKSEISQLLLGCVDASKNANVISKLLGNIENVLTEREAGLQQHFNLKCFNVEPVEEQIDPKHTDKRRKNVIFGCKTCNQLFPSVTQLKQHEKVHRIKKRTWKKKMHGCEQCSDLFNSKLKLQIHQSQTHYGVAVDEKIQCGQCKEVFRSLVLRNKHMVETGHKTDEKAKWDCGKCGMSFLRSTALIKHMQYVHTKNKKAVKKDDNICIVANNVDNKKPQIKNYACIHCGRNFRSTTSLRIHVSMIHTGEVVQYRCGQCPKVFSTQNLLNKHIRGPDHAVDRNWICTHCGKSFLRSTDLKNHCYRNHIKEATTTQEKINQMGSGPFRCEYCQKVYLSKDAFKHHVQYKHTGEKKALQCTVCDQSFSTEYFLREHTVKLHGGKKPYECSVCGKGFWIQATLTSHYNRHLNESQEIQYQHSAAIEHQPSNQDKNETVRPSETTSMQPNYAPQPPIDSYSNRDQKRNYFDQEIDSHPLEPVGNFSNYSIQVVKNCHLEPVQNYSVQVENPSIEPVNHVQLLEAIEHPAEIDLDEAGISASHILHSMIGQ